MGWFKITIQETIMGNCKIEFWNDGKWKYWGNNNTWVENNLTPIPQPSKEDWLQAGITCEILTDDWHKTNIIYVSEQIVVVSNSGIETAVIRGVTNFRPIKSDREKAIEKASKIMFDAANGIINDISLGALYDAGLLRIAEDK